MSVWLLRIGYILCFAYMRAQRVMQNECRLRQWYRMVGMSLCSLHYLEVTSWPPVPPMHRARWSCFMWSKLPSRCRQLQEIPVPMPEEHLSKFGYIIEWCLWPRIQLHQSYYIYINTQHHITCTSTAHTRMHAHTQLHIHTHNHFNVSKLSTLICSSLFLFKCTFLFSWPPLGGCLVHFVGWSWLL